MSSNTTPFLIRLSVAAESIGVTQRVLAKTIADQLIPVTAVQVGRMTFLKRGEFQAWLGCIQQPAGEMLTT